MKKALIYMSLIILLASVAAACSNIETAPVQTAGIQQTQETQQPEATAKAAAVVNITAAEAKARIDSEEEIIIVDVRTQEEYDDAHIPDAILLPVDTIATEAENILPDKEAVYFIYCRSGNRSATGAAMLVKMGYQNIYDFGGIIDWPYEIIGNG